MNDPHSFNWYLAIPEEMMTEDTPYYDFEQLDESQAFWREYYF